MTTMSQWTFLDQWLAFSTNFSREYTCSQTMNLTADAGTQWSFVSTCDVFNCLFPLDVQNEIQLLSEVFCYSLLICLLGFWLSKKALVKVGIPISDGIVFVFHIASCVRGLKSLKRYWLYLIPFRRTGAASRMVSLSNYCIWCLFLYLI